MKKLSLTLVLSFLLGLTCVWAQDAETDSESEDSKLKISGSVDTYYKYDFSGTANIPTSFAEDQNSISLGMLDLTLEKAQGKASFLAELAFGPRNAGSAGPGPIGYIVGEGENQQSDFCFRAKDSKPLCFLCFHR